MIRKHTPTILGWAGFICFGAGLTKWVLGDPDTGALLLALSVICISGLWTITRVEGDVL